MKQITSLRGLAIILIILFHLNPEHFPYGYFGVEVFLVISGYLLMKSFQKQQMQIRLGEFARKKVLRLFTPCLLYTSHSVPSPKVWKSFFRNLIAKNRISDVSGVFMRKKTFSPARGWRCDSFVVESTNTPPLEDSIYETAYGRGFLEGMFSRPSCEKCPAKNMESGSDITLGDFWGVENYFPDLVKMCIRDRVSAGVTALMGSFSSAMQPQITKSYAAGDYEHMWKLVFNGTRYSFFLLAVFILPLCFNIDFILSLWLKEIPAYTNICLLYTSQAIPGAASPMPRWRHRLCACRQGRNPGRCV